MARLWAVLLCMSLVGCSGAAQNIRRTTGQRERCIYVPRRSPTLGALDTELRSTRTGLEIVPVAATPRAPSVVPLSPPSTPPLKGLSGEGLGNGISQGVLRVVPEVAIAAEEAGAGGATGELFATGGAVVAAAGGVFLVCLTVSAAMDGAKAPIDIADEFYGTHFGDVSKWAQRQHPVVKAPQARMGPASTSLAMPGTSPTSEVDKETQKNRGRIYVTYTKLNKMTRRYYAGRTSMIVDFTKSLEEQAWLAVILRDANHHIDEDAEPKDTAFDFSRVDVFDVGSAIDYGKRYDDDAYWRIRGREQQLIDSLGGAWTDTARPYRTENAIRSVAKDNPRGRWFHDAATERWGQRHPYTGY